MSAFLFFIWSASRLPVPVRFCSFFVSRLSFVLSFVCSFFHSFHVSVFRFVFVFHFVSCRCCSSGRFLCARALFLFVAFLLLPFRCSARSSFSMSFWSSVVLSVCLSFTVCRYLCLFFVCSSFVLSFMFWSFQFVCLLFRHLLFLAFLLSLYLSLVRCISMFSVMRWSCLFFAFPFLCSFCCAMCRCFCLLLFRVLSVRSAVRFCSVVLSDHFVSVRFVVVRSMQRGGAPKRGLTTHLQWQCDLFILYNLPNEKLENHEIQLLEK